MRTFSLILITAVVLSFGTTAYAVDKKTQPTVIVQPEPGPQGPQGETGATGPAGPQGAKGDTTYVSVSDPSFVNMLQTRTPTAGQFTFAGGLNFNQDYATSITAGVRYGINDCFDLVGAIDVDRHDNVNAYFGFTMALNKCSTSSYVPIQDYHAPYTGTLK